MPGPPTGGTAAPRVDWAALKSYIARKENYEAQNGEPAPLSESEISAIAVLLRPAPLPEPDLDGRNWLGHLNHFQQVHSQKVTFTDEARQEPRLGKAPELRWACAATIESTGARFPQPGYGLGPGASRSPDFTRKQDAKQYAAKSVCEWLIDSGYMLPSGDLPKFPKPFAPPALASAAAASVLGVKRSPSTSPPGSSAAVMSRKKQVPIPSRSSSDAATPQRPSPPAQPVAAPKNATLRLALSTTSGSTTSTPTSATSSSATTPAAGAPLTASPLDAARTPTPDSDAPASKRVVELCKRLNLPPPRYDIKPDPSTPDEDIWNGRADFENHPRIPDALGTVTGSHTKAGTKERMAGDILGWLIQQVEKREREARALLDE
ncbi:hypothetical protein CCHL11_03408 [Colletotrichum chlorophyti]|uniref:DRBM domain-containing protein n=1 Tax=Colletotrichum chlorophyti TaxID=708187 RepID=A0A1Q8S095_9PEZI|nr:hypothetical protein CCHL11_03408 [Colletotrichum chlorophyti]